MRTRSTPKDMEESDLEKLEIPVQEYKSAYFLFQRKQRQTDKSLTSTQISELWESLEELERQQYEKEFQKHDLMFREKLHNYNYEKKGLKPPKFVAPVHKPHPPPSAYNRWASENNERLRKEALDAYKAGKKKQWVARYMAGEWEKLSKAEKKPFQDQSDKDRKEYEKTLEEWLEKYGEEEDKKKSAKKSRSKSKNGKKSGKKAAGNKKGSRSKSKDTKKKEKK